MDTLAYERGYAIRWDDLKSGGSCQSMEPPGYFRTAKQRTSFRAGWLEAKRDFDRLRKQGKFRKTGGGA